MNETRKRRNAHFKGQWSEWLAAAFLLFKGYRILAFRHRTRLGEIDIVARKGDLAAIVEVKARVEVSTAVDAVSWASQQRIRNAADLWLARQNDAAKLSMRFDVVAVRSWRIPVHLEDAF